MTAKEKAVLDTIAYAEGTLGASQNGYDIIVTFKTIVGWTPDTKIKHGNSEWKQKWGTKKDGTPAYSTAAGRYQFLGSTWISVNGKKNLPMTKDNQDKAALKLITNRLKNTNITIEGLNSQTTFNAFLNRISNIWASIPQSDGQGRYEGQKAKSATKLYEIFNKAYDIYKNQ